MNGWLLFLILLNAYLLLVFILVKTGWMKRLNMSLFGPALMLKTERGRGILDWFARARWFFDRSAGLGLWLTGVVMILMSLLLLLQLFFIFQLKPEDAPSALYALGIPGVNPLIPVGFGIIALIFAVVVHEFSHGILARVYDLKVKTMGILIFIIPVGAFVEPDEEELKAAPRRQRVKVFAAGIISNLFFAVLFGILFSSVLMAQAQPIDGAPIQTVIDGSPAEAAGLVPGDILVKVNGSDVRSQDDFTRAISGIQPNATIPFVTRDAVSHDVTTRRCIDVYAAASCGSNPNRTVIGISVYPTQRVKDSLVHPFQSAESFLFYISLPFQALPPNNDFPLAGIFTDFYETPFDPAVFWFLVNLAYWLFWIDLMLGLTNALPIVPLDGGHIFKDYVASFVHGWDPDMSPERRDRIVRRWSTTVALSLLTLVILQFVGPYLASLLL